MTNVLPVPPGAVKEKVNASHSIINNLHLRIVYILLLGIVVAGGFSTLYAAFASVK